MTVKGQVKEFVHEVKRHFSHHKHHRDESTTSSHTVVSDDSSHTAHSGGHSRPGTPERELSSHLGTPEHKDLVPTTPERKRVLSTSSHKHNVFLKLRRRKSSNLSIDPRSRTPEYEDFPRGSQPGTPEHSATLSNPGTPESSLFSHGSVRQRVPSTPSRKPNVLHKFRRGSSHFKSSSESHAPEKTEIPVLHHHSSLSKLREHVESHAPEKTEKPEIPAIHHQSSLSKLREDLDAFQADVPGTEADREVAETPTAKDGDSTLSPPPIIITCPPIEEKTESHGDTLQASEHEDEGDIVDRPDVELECEPVLEAEEKDTGSFVEVEDVQTQTDMDTVQTQADAGTQTSPSASDTLVAPISQEACDAPSISDPTPIIDSALNPDDDNPKGVDDPVDPPVFAVTDDDQELPTEDVKEPTESEMKDNEKAEDQTQSTIDTSLSGETSVPSLVPDPVTTLPITIVDKPTPAPPTPEPQSYPPAHSAQPASVSAPNSSPYLPRLTAASMFLPIPNTDPLSPLLTKHVPPEQRPRRDVTGEWTGREMHEMVMSNSWRALARMARDLIVASDPEDLPRILDLWSLRLSALARLRLTNQASAECTNLFAVLNAIPPISSAVNLVVSGTVTRLAAGSSSSLHNPVVSATPKSPVAMRPQSPAVGVQPVARGSTPSLTPTQRLSPLPVAAGHGHAQVLAARLSALSAYPFELSVLRARVHYWAGDARGYIDALAGLLSGCKAKARAEGKIVRELREAKPGKQGKENKSEETVESGRVGDNQQEGCEDEDESGGDDGVGEGEDSNIDNQSGEGEDSEENDQKGEEERSDEQQKAEAASDDTDADDDESDGALATAEANFSMWLERSARVCLMIASQLVEMKDYHAAITLLLPLCTQQLSPDAPPVPSSAIHSAVARIYLLSGNISKAAEHFEIVTSCADVQAGTIATNTALLCSASGDWPRAEAALREVLEQDPHNYTAMNNLAVTLLAQGRVRDGIGLLESAMRASPASVLSAEPFIFNLSTLYELRSSTAIDKKRELLIEVARWSGDGLRAACLKMPSS